MMENILNQVYYDPSSPASYGGKEAVYKAAKALYQKVTRRKVATWLSKQLTYTMLRPVCYHFKTNRVFAKGIGYQWQADLVDLGSVQNYNYGFRYLLTCIDVFFQICLGHPTQKQDWNYSFICIQNYFVKQSETNISTD